MKKVLSIGIISCFLGAALAGCTNFFHDLIPPDGDRILSFSVEGQLGSAVIGDNTVFVELEYGTDPRALVPVITVSPRATLIPMTLEYIQNAFPSADLKDLAMGLYTAHDLEAYVEDMIRLHKENFTVPSLELPIDFTGPVDFFVIAGQGNMRRYTVTMEVESNEAFLTGFAFSKYDNPELINDALGIIDEAARTITVEALYPAEMTLSYELVPSFEIRGNKAELDGAEIVSRETALKFAPTLGVPQTRTITVIREGNTKEYSLTVTFKEDPDSIRSITDFRFDKANNPSIAATAVASILNSENYGSITVQVFYAGAKPALLTPAFISPGTVSVSGMTQNSRVSSHDFSNALEYRVVSRNNKFVRIYTVRVEYIDVSAASPVINSFRFSCGVNHELVQDTAASISDSAGIILITASYGGSFAPSLLVPEFHATGIVTVRGAVQISDFTAQDFSAQVKYTVTDPLNPLLSRDYWVKVSFTRDTSSDARITVFTFHPDENPALNDELITRIDQNALTISVYAPVGSGVTAGIMTPRFVAVGHVEVGGVVQASGVSGRMFNAPVVYTVVSANGANRKDYTVTVSELQSTLYVNQNAHGLSDGTSWQNAFHDLNDACDAAAQFPENVLKEIWIAAGTYVPDDHFEIVSNTCYIGGFAGHEASRSERNVAANAVAISGGTGVSRLFSASGELTGELFFEDLVLKDHASYAIYVNLDDNAQITIENCTFSNFTAVDNIVRIVGGSAEMSNTAFSACSGSAVVFVDSSGETDITRVTIEDSPALAFDLRGNGSKELEDVKVNRGRGIEISNSSGDITINDMELHDITGNGIVLNNVTGETYLSGIDGRNIRGILGISGSDASVGSFTLTDSKFISVGNRIEVYGKATVRNVEINNTRLFVTRGDNATIDNVVVNGEGISISGTVRVLNSTVKNCNSAGILAAFYIGDNNTISLFNVSIDTSMVGIASYILGDGMTASIIVDGLELHNITEDGILLEAEDARTGSYPFNFNTNLSNINASNINGNAVDWKSNVGSAVITGPFTLTDSTFNNIGSITVSGSSVDVTIQRTAITNSSAVALPRGGALDITTSGNTVIDTVTIDGVPGGRGIYLTGSENTSLTNVTIDTVSSDGIYDNGRGTLSVDSLKLRNIGGYGIYNRGGTFTVDGLELQNIGGGGIYNFYDSSVVSLSNITANNINGNIAVEVIGETITMNHVTIDGVPDGSAINAQSDNMIQISNATIKNCKRISLGGIVDLRGNGNKTVSNTTIENIEMAGSGIMNSSGNLTVSNTTIRNALTDNLGGGVYYMGTGKLIVNNNSRFENCRSENGYGAIYTSGTGHELSDTEFINCTAKDWGLILGAGTFAFIRNCTFTHNSSLVNMGTSTNSSIFWGSGGNFENCTFNNLKGSRVGENYLFSAFSEYPNTSTGIGGTVFNDGGNYTLKNCTFNFNAGSAGLLVLVSGPLTTGGDHIDHLLIDGVTINNTGGQTPLIWLDDNRPSGTFQFKANNIYNGTTLNNAAAITSLATPASGVIRLSGGAVPTLVP